MERNTESYFQNSGLLAYLWDIKPGKRVMPSQVRALGEGAIIILEDVFASEYDDEQLYRLFHHLGRLECQKFLVITDHTDRLSSFMSFFGPENGKERRGINAGYNLDLPEEPWENVFFGTRFDSQKDGAGKIDDLMRTHSVNRFVIFEVLTDLDLANDDEFEQWFVPKCPKCNGRGWYFTNPFNITNYFSARPDMGTTICRECPGWDYEKSVHQATRQQERDGYYLRDTRAGGGIDWVILSGGLSLTVLGKIQGFCEKYNLPLYVPPSMLISETNLPAIPDFIGNTKVKHDIVA